MFYQSDRLFYHNSNDRVDAPGHSVEVYSSIQMGGLLRFSMLFEEDREKLGLDSLNQTQRFAVKLLREISNNNSRGVNIVFYETCDYIKAHLSAPAKNFQLNQFGKLFQPHHVSFNKGRPSSCSYHLHDKLFIAISTCGFMEQILPHLQKQRV
jgi:hypothetical protein